MMKLASPPVLRDTLGNINPGSGASDDYCRGLIVGVTAGLMAAGEPFEDALTQVAAHSPADFGDRRVVHKLWGKEFWKAHAAAHAPKLKKENSK